MKLIEKMISCTYLVACIALVPVSLFAQSTGLPDPEPDNDKGYSPEKHKPGLTITATQIIALNESENLSALLRNGLSKKGVDYVPRTEHLNQDGSPKYINRLILEDSPYLIQHAHNPVNWYPWSSEAFAKAEAENKPVFMSIGYATCHWCHVMERESFENEAIAKILNDSFISIKVDREQRPDVDATYMTAVQIITGRGGWPMSSFLTADAKPFYGGTYFPPDSFTKLLERVSAVWGDQKAELLVEAERLATAVADTTRLQNEGATVGTEVIGRAVMNLIDNMDELQGGFSAAPKFPQEPSHFLLLEQALLNQDKTLLDASDFTLTQMSAGGIHDQIGGGFHRYSVDNAWLVPHFEKMLYNQAALARIYYQAYSLTNDAGHLRTSTRILDYVVREMTSPEGGFYSATDADSEGEEGLFFIWTPEEIKTVLGEKDAEFAIAIWNVSESGNFEHGNILNLSGTLEEITGEFDLQRSEFSKRLDELSHKLLTARKKRVPPLLDDKLITEWNGMMITAFAEVGGGLGNKQYLDAAEKAANTIWSLNRRSSGGLWRAHFKGSSSVEASQPDYAFFAEAMLALYDATGSDVWLDRAVQLVTEMDAVFWDSVDGAYFLGVEKVGGAELPARPKDLFDNATPSGNAAALRVLTRLWHRTGDAHYQEQANRLLSAFSGHLTQYASGFGYFLTAASELINGESGPQRYAGRGNVKIKGAVEANNRIKITVDIQPGWHINSANPLQDYLIPTRLLDIKDNEIDDVHYPAGKRQSLGFQQSELSLYEGTLELNAQFEDLDSSSRSELGALENLRTVSLQLQACNDSSCLAPETVMLKISAAGTREE